MGCCVSTDKGSSVKKEAHLEVGLQSFNKKPILENRAPPPSAEEETVKEVLSETPKLKASPKARIFIPQQEEQKITQIEKPVFVKIQGKESLDFNIKTTEPKPPVNVIEESASEDVSEICSVSVSESVSTITDRRDEEEEEEEEEVRPRRVFRSPARTGSRNQVVGRSPTRKLDQSPARRNGVVNGGSSSVRLVQSRDPTVRRGSRPDPPRKDPGESSMRRSRSPAMNRSVMGRSPSGRKTTNQFPGRARLDPGESGDSKKMEQQQHGNTTTTTTMEGKWPSSNNNGATTSSAPNESLENPLVSLECFIFL